MNTHSSLGLQHVLNFRYGPLYYEQEPYCQITGSMSSEKKVNGEERPKNTSKKKLIVSSRDVKEESEGGREKVKRTNSVKVPKDKKEKKKGTEKKHGGNSSKGMGPKPASKTKLLPVGILSKETFGLPFQSEAVTSVHEAARMGDKQQIKKFVEKDGRKNVLDFKVSNILVCQFVANLHVLEGG